MGNICGNKGDSDDGSGSRGDKKPKGVKGRAGHEKERGVRLA